MKNSINKLLFNVKEFEATSNDPDGFITMLFALYIRKNTVMKRMASSRRALCDKLYITRFPVHLVNRKLLLENPGGIFANFETGEPQSYVKNCAFLHLNIESIHKYHYIKMLSQRTIDDSSDSIPDFLVDESYYTTNPLITHKNHTIHFKLEKI